MSDIPWLTELQAVLGWHEVRDRVRLSAWLKSDGKTLGDPGKLPWCGDAVDTALFLALPDELRPGALGENPYWALNWALLGVPCLEFYGGIGVFKRKTTAGTTAGHVGILLGHSDTHYRVLGGNSGDAVASIWSAKTKCVAIRWPKTFSNPKIALPHSKVTGKEGSQA